MNIAQDEYYTPILLSVPATGENSLAFLSVLLGRLCSEQDHRRAPLVILHTPAVAIATATAGDRRAFLRTITHFVENGNLTVWHAGYAGAAADLLTDEEFLREREWAMVNPWKYGYGAVPFRREKTILTNLETDSGERINKRILAIPRYFPFRLRFDQVRQLQDCGADVCFGYGCPPQPGTVGELMLVASSGSDRVGNSRTVMSRYMVLDSSRQGVLQINGRIPTKPSVRAAGRARTGSARAVDVNHVVLPRGIAATADANAVAEAIRWATAKDPSYRRGDAETAAHPLTYYSGVDPYAIEREPAVLATLARIRKRSETENSAMRRLLCATADRAPVGRRVLQAPEIDERAPLPHPPPHDRELQGGNSGSLTMQEGELRVSFFGGRFSGVATNGKPPPTERRAQGFLRRDRAAARRPRSATVFLETAFAAWFTGMHTRGIQEHAFLGDEITVESSGVVIDDFPGLLFGQRVTTGGTFPPDTSEISVFDLPLCSVGDAKEIAVGWDEGNGGANGGSSQRQQASGFISLIPESGQRELVVSARHVVLHLPQGDLRISVAAPDLRVPFRFAVVPKAGDSILVMRTVPFMSTPAIAHVPAGRAWTVAYIFSAASVPVERIAITPEIAAETFGFTYVAEAFRRSK